MTKDQILQKAIEKAVENGYRCLGMRVTGLRFVAQDRLVEISESYEGGVSSTVVHPFEIIFDKSFAKAFWNGDRRCYHKKGANSHTLHDCGLPAWKWNLQQMVISEDPILYPEQLID